MCELWFDDSFKIIPRKVDTKKENKVNKVETQFEDIFGALFEH